MNEFIYVKNNTLSHIYCNKLIEFFENNKDKQKLINNEIIKSIIVNIHFTEIEKILKDRINLIDNIYYYINYFLENKIIYFEKIKKISIKNVSIIKYIKNEGKYIYHNELLYCLKQKKQTFLIFIWYLNDIEEGGETEFFGNYKIKPEKGKLLLFPSEWFFSNTEKIPLSNDKYILSGYIYYI